MHHKLLIVRKCQHGFVEQQLVVNQQCDWLCQVAAARRPRAGVQARCSCSFSFNACIDDKISVGSSYLIFKIMHETKARQLIDTDGSVAALLALSPSAIAVLRTQHLHTVAASEEHLRALFCRTTSTPCQDHSLVHTVSFVPDRPNFCFAQYIETARLVPTTIVRIRCRKARIFSDTRRMAGWGAVSEVAVQAASEHSTLQSPGSALLSPDPSSDDSESWSSPAQHLSFPAANPTGTAGKVPPLALPTADHNNLTKSTRLATTDPPDTPELAEANPAAPSYAFKKPPKPFSRQPKQYERSNLSKLEHVPVNWIGDSTDHTDYRPTNTASYSNHEADIVRVATFSTMGKKHDDAEAADCKQNMSRSRPRRRWCVWALVGVAAGTAIGVAYKVLGDHLALDMPDISEMQLRHGSSTRHDDSHVAARHLSKTASDHEMMQQLMRRKARKVSQT